MILMIDNYDSFTYNLVQYLNELGEEVRVYRNDEISLDKVRELNPEMIVISPGPKTPDEAGISIEIIKKFYRIIPILGICLGHQSLIQILGGKIIKAKTPVHGKVEDISHTGTGVFKGLKNSIKVTRYHSLIADRSKLPEELMITAETIDGEIMGVRHKKYLLEGVQFHPEALLTECGHEMLANFLKEAKSRYLPQITQINTD
ncbi:MAG: aminodeoxychorismate/anthranilate synthase component II [Fusobacteriia bacterium 4572_74]|nr:MAG: aminodeoxychorismate/anthranilate synthase component II [Fusobacteriia bacterium 4572_74]